MLRQLFRVFRQSLHSDPERIETFHVVLASPPTVSDHAPRMRRAENDVNGFLAVGDAKSGGAGSRPGGRRSGMEDRSCPRGVEGSSGRGRIHNGGAAPPPRADEAGRSSLGHGAPGGGPTPSRSSPARKLA